jgi:macrolide transport system ATP-binding/permease protein
MRRLTRLGYWLRHSQMEADLTEEIEFHRNLKQRELEEAGLPALEASTASRRALGNVMLAREDARAVWIWPWLESIWQDLAYGARNFRRQPGFTAVALLTLASAIGLNTSLFTVFNAIAFRPWPVKDPSRVVNVHSIWRTPQGAGTGGFSLAEYRYLADHIQSFDGLIAMREIGGIKVGDGGKTVTGDYVSGNYFRVLGVEMERGRGFLPEEDHVATPYPVAVFSHRAWQNRFGGDPAIVGKQIRLDGVPFTIVGITSPDFAGTSPNRNDVWIPMPARALVRPDDPDVTRFLRDADYCCSSIAGRLAPGITRDQARSELEVLHKQFGSQCKLDRSGILLSGTAFLGDPGSKGSVIIPAIALMFLGVMLVLLLACANVGNLLLARAAARKREIAIRLAIGAGQTRLIRQLLTEGLTLAWASGGIGILIAYILPSYILNRVLAADVSFHLQPDATVFFYTLVIAVFACVAFGLVPALHGTRGNITGSLKDEAGQQGAKLSLRSLLLAVQVAVSIVLLVSGGLLVRGVQRARLQDPGFSVGDIAVISFELPANAYSPSRSQSLFSGLLRDLKRVDELQPFGFTSRAPLSSARDFIGFRLPGENQNQEKLMLALGVSAGYFEVLRIPIVAGRNFVPADAASGSIIINQAMAKQYWSKENPVGKKVISGTTREVIGVARDARTWGLDQVEPAIFLPFSGPSVPELLIRKTRTDSSQAVAAITARVDPRIRLHVSPLSDNLQRWLVPARVMATLAGVLGALALTLASIGMFGVFAYVVQQRTQEIGIRMALGAQPKQVIRLVLGKSSRAVLAGLAIGLVCSMAASRLMERYLYGVSPFDPIAYGSVALVLALAAIAASYVPARRATRVDPLTALRYD